MNNKATITIYEIRCALKSHVALGRMTQETADNFSKLLNLDSKEKEYDKKEEANFFKELLEFFQKWDLMLCVDGAPTSRLEYIVGAFGNRCFYHPKGMHTINAQDVTLLPKIAKRQKMFDKLKLNQSVHIEDVRPILQAITRVEVGSWCYVTDDEYKGMLQELKEKHNLEYH